MCLPEVKMSDSWGQLHRLLRILVLEPQAQYFNESRQALREMERRRLDLQRLSLKQDHQHQLDLGPSCGMSPHPKTYLHSFLRASQAISSLARVLLHLSARQNDPGDFEGCLPKLKVWVPLWLVPSLRL